MRSFYQSRNGKAFAGHQTKARGFPSDFAQEFTNSLSFLSLSGSIEVRRTVGDTVLTSANFNNLTWVDEGMTELILAALDGSSLTTSVGSAAGTIRPDSNDIFVNDFEAGDEVEIFGDATQYFAKDPGSADIRVNEGDGSDFVRDVTDPTLITIGFTLAHIIPYGVANYEERFALAAPEGIIITLTRGGQPGGFLANTRYLCRADLATPLDASSTFPTPHDYDYYVWIQLEMTFRINDE